ncbi:MAG: ribosome silencing factor [Bacteroidia bacterium]
MRIGKPKSKKKKDDVELLREVVIRGLQEKKGHEIISLDLRKTGNSVADCFVVCHGESTTQVEALARSVEEQVYKELKEDPAYKEGFQNLEWVLLDYFNVVVHIFVKERREFYGIERLWADAEIQKVANS